MAEESDEDRQWRERRAREKEARPEGEARPQDTTEVPWGRRDKAIPLGKDPTILCWLAIIGVVIVVAVIVYAAVTYPLEPSSQPLTVTVENKNGFEIKVFLYVDEEYQGWSYIDGGDKEWYRFEGFDNSESHQVKVRSTVFFSDFVVTTEAGNNVSITVHQDGRITYFFW